MAWPRRKGRGSQPALRLGVFGRDALGTLFGDSSRGREDVENMFQNVFRPFPVIVGGSCCELSRRAARPVLDRLFMVVSITPPCCYRDLRTKLWLSLLSNTDEILNPLPSLDIHVPSSYSLP